MNNLEDIKNRLAAATPGPWKATPIQEGPFAGIESSIHDPRGIHILLGNTDGTPGQAKTDDADFIAHAPEDIARLVKALEAVAALANAAKPLTVWGGGTAPGIVSAGDIRAAITEALDS